MPRQLHFPTALSKKIPEIMAAPKVEAVPESVSPMLAQTADKPFDRTGWLFELKFDGYRIIARKNKKISLYSRNNLFYNDKFPTIALAMTRIPFETVLDGEVVVLDAQGRSDFHLLQDYLKNGNGNPVYMVFDILFYDHYDLRPLPLNIRKKILQELLPDLPEIRYVDHVEENGEIFFDKATVIGSEGIMAKDKDSPYISARSDRWLKIKSRRSQDAVIAGYTEPRKSRKHIGSLILGAYSDGQLVYIGHSGGGFREKELQELKIKLDNLASDICPFEKEPMVNEKPTWVKPELVCEIEFIEWTPEGLMRHPIYKGLRDDKDQSETMLETSNEPVKRKSGQIRFTNLEKIYWPDEGYTKGDMLRYYDGIAEYILPYIKDRPHTLNRFPGGLAGESFYQKNITDAPPGIRTMQIHSDSDDKSVNYLVAQDKASLLYMANLGCIEINPWNSRIDNLEKPDYLILDLDPVDIDFKEVVKAAQVTHDILETINVENYCKTSGATGLHIFIPLGAKYDYDQTREFAHLVNVLVHERLPETTSLERMPEKRQKKVYLDYLQNRRGQTLACAYSLRPEKGAPVSTPLKWSEVNAKLDPKQFNISNTLARVKKHGDLWSAVLGEGIDMAAAIKRIERLLHSN